MLQIIQNDPEVPPGNLIDHLTIPYHVHHPYRDSQLPAMADISALIVMGGSMGANDDQQHPFLRNLKDLIRTVVAARIPYLGICLGGQLLAAALGAQVVAHRWEEMGTLPLFLTQNGVEDRLFSGIAGQFTTFQWHHDSFDIPDSGIVLASSSICPHQAFRVGDSAWGLQFHPEVTGKIIHDWCAWDSATLQQTGALVAAFAREADSYTATSRQLLHNFLLSAGLG